MANRYEDSEQYEIQFTTRQLALVFGGLVLIVAGVFVGGILIGRGLAPGEAEALLARRAPVADEPAVVGQGASETERVSETTPAAGEGVSGGDVLQLPVRPVGRETATAPASAAPGGGRVASSSPDQLAARTLAVPDASPAALAPPRPSSASRVAATTPPPAAPASSPGGSAAGQFTIQLAAFRDRNAAERLLARLAERGHSGGYLEATPAGIFRVRVGAFESRDAAREVALRLQREEFQTLVTQR